MTEEMTSTEGVEAGQEAAEAPDFGGGSEAPEGLDLPGLEPEGPSVEDLQKQVEQLESEKAGILEDLRSTRSKNNERMALLEDRLGQINERLQPQAEEEPDPEPDREEDPMGWIAWDRRQQGKKLDRIEERFEAEDMEAQAEAAIGQIVAGGRAAEDEFLQQSGMERTEYLGMLNAVRDSRIAYYEAYGYGHAEAKAVVGREEINWLAGQLAQGSNPARQIVEVFKKLGLELPKVEEKKPETTENGGLSKIEAAKAGQKTGGMDQASGNTGGGVVLSLAQLAEMSDEEFNKAMDYLDKHPSKWKELNEAGKTVV